MNQPTAYALAENITRQGSGLHRLVMLGYELLIDVLYNNTMCRAHSSSGNCKLEEGRKRDEKIETPLFLYIFLNLYESFFFYN